MTLDEALTILKHNSDDGEKGLRQLEANLDQARQVMGPMVDKQLAEAKRGIEAARVVIAWVEEKRLTS